MSNSVTPPTPPTFLKHPRSQSPVVNLAAYLNTTRVTDETRAKVFCESADSEESVVIESFHYVPVDKAVASLVDNNEAECARDLLTQSAEQMNKSN